MAEGYQGYSGYGAATSAADVRNRLTQAMLQSGMSAQPIHSPWQGAAQTAQTLFGSLALRKQMQNEAANRQQMEGALGSFANGLPGQPGAISPAPSSAAPSPAAPSAGADPAGHEDFIRQYAASKGINPDMAVAVARAEGMGAWSSKNPNAASMVDRNPDGTPFSFGDFQLNVRNGLGNAALAAGIDPRDPNQWQAADKFSIDQMAKPGGMRPWLGDAGVKAWGIGQNGNWDAPRIAAPGTASADMPAAGASPSSSGNIGGSGFRLPDGSPIVAPGGSSPAATLAQALTSRQAPAAQPMMPPRTPTPVGMSPDDAEIAAAYPHAEGYAGAPASPAGMNPQLSPTLMAPAAPAPQGMPAPPNLTAQLANQMPAPQQFPQGMPWAGNNGGAPVGQVPPPRQQMPQATVGNGGIAPKPPQPSPAPPQMAPFSSAPQQGLAPPESNWHYQPNGRNGPTMVMDTPGQTAAWYTPNNPSSTNYGMSNSQPPQPVAPQVPPQMANGVGSMAGQTPNGSGAPPTPLPNPFQGLMGLFNPSTAQGGNSPASAPSAGHNPLGAIAALAMDPNSDPQTRQLAGHLLDLQMQRMIPQYKVMTDPISGQIRVYDERDPIHTLQSMGGGINLPGQTQSGAPPVALPGPAATPAAPAPGAAPAAPQPAPQPSGSSPTPLNDTTIPSRVQGEDYLDQVEKLNQGNPTAQLYAQRARAILRGQMPAPTGKAADDPIGAQAMNLVMSANPNFNSGLFQNRQNALKDYNDGQNLSSAGGQINAMNAGLQHLHGVAQASERLGAATKGHSPAWNQFVGGPWADHFDGKSELALAREDFNAAVQPFASEITKFFSGSEGDAETRNAYRTMIDENATVEQRRAAIGRLAEAAQTKINVLGERFKAATGGTAEYPVELQKTLNGLREIKQIVGGGAGAQPTEPKPAQGLLPPGGSTTINGVTITRVN